MGKILSGGYKEGYSKKDLGAQNSAQQEQQPQEGWAPYLGRNFIAKAPSYINTALRSGFGFGDVLGNLAEETKAPEIVKSGLQSLLPKGSQAQQQFKEFPTTIARNVIRSAKNPWNDILFGAGSNEAIEQRAQKTNLDLPDYLTESRPGDYPAELAAQSLPFLSFHGPMALAKSAGVLGTAIGGGKLLAAAGHALGNKFGLPKTLESAGELVGNVGGAYAAHSLIERPSKTIQPEIDRLAGEEHTAKLAEFDARKKALEAEHAAKLAAIESAEEARASGQKEDVRPQIAEAESDHAQAVLERAQKKSDFQRGQAKKVELLEQKKSDYEAKRQALESERAGYYNEATALENHGKHDATGIRKVMNLIGDNITKGLDSLQQTKVVKWLADLDKSIADGTLSVQDAKLYKQQIGEQYGSQMFKHYQGKIGAALRDFIRENSSAEHNAWWDHAEGMHGEYMQAKKGQTKYNKQIDKQIQKIGKEKYDPIKDAELKLKEKRAADTLKILKERGSVQAANRRVTDQRAAAKRKFIESNNRLKAERNELVKSTKKQEGWANVIQQIIKNKSHGAGVALGAILGMMGVPGSGALASALVSLGKFTHGQYKIAQHALKNHPELFSKFVDLVHEGVKGDIPLIVANLNTLNKELEKVGSTSKKKTAKPVISGIASSRILSGGLKSK